MRKLQIIYLWLECGKIHIKNQTIYVDDYITERLHTWLRMSFSNSFSVIIKSLFPHPSANDTRDSLEILPSQGLIDRGWKRRKPWESHGKIQRTPLETYRQQTTLLGYVARVARSREEGRRGQKTGILHRRRPSTEVYYNYVVFVYCRDGALIVQLGG